MIESAKYNGINFSKSFSRKSPLYNFDAQRKRDVLPIEHLYYLCFFVSGVEDETTAKLIVSANDEEITAAEATNTSGDNWVFYMHITAEILSGLPGLDTYFIFEVDGQRVYSEIYQIQPLSYLTDNEICFVTGSNADNKHGFIENRAFGYFKYSEFRSDIFLKESTTYKYSYSREMILKSENQIGKRFVFKDLTMYNQNLLKWLCNTETLTINGKSYQIISDFSEVEADQNTELMSLQADFVEVEQSFFTEANDETPYNIFTQKLFSL